MRGRDGDQTSAVYGPVVKRRRWGHPLIWAAVIGAAVGAFGYVLTAANPRLVFLTAECGTPGLPSWMPCHSVLPQHGNDPLLLAWDVLVCAALAVAIVALFRALPRS